MSSEFKIEFDTAKKASPMDKVIAHLALQGLRPRGSKQWRGTCPFCKLTDCFVISADGGKDKLGAFHCFKCTAGGDQIELVSLVRGFPRRDAKGCFAAAKELHETFIGKLGLDSSNTSPAP